MPDGPDKIIISGDELTNLIGSLPENEGLTFVSSDRLDPEKGEYGFRIKHIKEPDLAIMGQDESQFNVVFMLDRPGAAHFMTYLEHTYFEPETPLNDEFGYIMYRWQEMMWIVVSIPSEKKDFAFKSADTTGMRLEDGIPFMFTCDGTKKFPLEGKHVWSLSNKSGDVIYQGPGGREERIVEDRYNAQKVVKKTQDKYK